MTDDDTTPFLDDDLPDIDDVAIVELDPEPRDHHDEDESDDR